MCCASSWSSSLYRPWREPSTVLAFVSQRSFTGTKISTLAFQPKPAVRQPTGSSRRLRLPSRLRCGRWEPLSCSYSCSIAPFTTRRLDGKAQYAEMLNKVQGQLQLLGSCQMHTSSKPTNRDKASSSSHPLHLKANKTKRTTQTPSHTKEETDIIIIG